MNRGKYTMDEASLTRAYQHVVQQKVPSWGVMTAYRYANSPKENRMRNKQLESDLRGMGLGFFKVEGHWQECQDSSLNYIDCPKDKLQDSVEESLFVPNISAEQIHQLGKKYEQDAVIYGGKDTNGNANLIFKNGEKEDIGSFQPGKIEQAYSKLKGGRTWVFKQTGEAPKTEPEVQPKAEPKKDTNKPIKLKSLLPKGVGDRMVKNPDTGKMIKMKSALKYDKQSPVHQTAVKMLQMLKKQAVS